ncbi:tetratricopeptide repeat protein [Eggerthellaceae bacterium zg-887]|uniref:tetratricopeptide repeat protein n=1 Tax=Xiamenia xianingshaonis TaxID=2682776 RepID=UPI0013EE3B25|nr:tetratricopeptide repeat protein [Xiamenia xianingshaonis]NGM16584.1 tetratricopeptide repeat protein [Eggerthellaceae bacterium zg-893]NHM16096.1 tetratricopeptide repeat protein [Xiamenia xianingshaonis]
MNNQLFQQARAAYSHKAYEQALAGFTRCLQDAESPLAPGEMGQLYHQIGNCLIKLNNPAEAIQAYTQATADTAYDAFGAVNYNLGMAYASLHDYEDAALHFEVAVSDQRYATPYKAFLAMGNALLKLGKSAEAGVAFREAALDESNPDPTKALLNLGVCFMALDRPADAVSSYESALQFVQDKATRNRLQANLGQAFVACGQMQKAITAFEAALADKSYFLSDSASVDYQRAIGAVSQGSAQITQVISPVRNQGAANADMSGFDVSSEGTPVYPDHDAYYYQDAYETATGIQPVEEDNPFFTATDEEIEQWSKGKVKADRKRRNVGLKALAVVILLVLAACAACVALYVQGWGYPSQQTVIDELFADPKAAVSTVFASEVNEDVATSMAEPIVQDDEPTIDGMEASMSDTTAYVTATTPEGGTVQYRIMLVRDFIGWKVSSVELYFPSQNQD